MNPPLPRIVCRSCSLLQDFRGQSKCIHCGKNFGVLDVAEQLQSQPKDKKLENRLLAFWEKQMSDDDGA